MGAQSDDPRLAVCKALHNLLTEINKTGSVTETTLLAFRAQIPATHEAFGSDAATQYVQELEEKATELYEIRVRLTHTRPGPEQDNLIRRAGKIHKWALADQRIKGNATYKMLSDSCQD